MKHLDGILKLVDTEFGAIEENGKFRSREEIDSVYKLMDIAKDIYCVWKYQAEMEDGYSEAYVPARGMVSYDDGVSYARGRGRGAKRYANGQYAPYSRSNGNSYDGGMSYRGGYSYDDGTEHYIQQLRDLMNNARDDNTRQSIQRMITEMENG